MRAVVNEYGPNLCVRRVQTARTRASCPVCIFQAERNISRVLRASIVASDHLHLRHKQKLHQLRQTAASSIQSSLGRLSEHLARQELPSACRPRQREVPDSLPNKSRALFPRERAQAACSPSRDHRQKKMSLNAAIPLRKSAFGFEGCQRRLGRLTIVGQWCSRQDTFRPRKLIGRCPLRVTFDQIHVAAPRRLLPQQRPGSG